MLRACLLLAGALLPVATLSEASTGNSKTPPLPANVTEVSGGYSWIENLCFDGQGHMYASERLRGQLLSTTPNASRGGGSGGGEYDTVVLLEGPFKLLLGCVTDETRHPGIIFVVGELQNKTKALVAVPAATPEAWQVVAFTNHTGNGIRIHEKTGLIYTSTEGTFLPGSGAVYVIDPSKPWGVAPAISLVENEWACDGLWIDQERDILYVGLLFTAEVWAYDLAKMAPLGTFGGLTHGHCSPLDLGVCAMDDFTLSRTNSSWIVAAAWTNNSIARFPTFSPSSGFETTTLLNDIQNPTSMRWGRGAGFANTSLFIAEGGGLISSEKKFRILEWKNANVD